MGTQDAVPAQGTISLEPQLSQVQTAKLNGVDFFADQTGVGATPTITWTAPTLGTPSRYELYVYEWSIDTNGKSVYAPVGDIYTTDTQVLLPPGIMRSGYYYSFTLSSEIQTYPTLDQAPLRSGLPDSMASVISGLVSP